MSIYPSLFENLYRSNPLILVDVGASGGIPEHWLPHRKYLQVIGFEPDARAFDELSKQQNQMTLCLNTGLYNRSGSFSFYFTRKQQNSSCFIPNRILLDRFHNPSRFDVINETTMECRALDEVLSEEGIKDVDFIKLDTQGSELAILKGARSILGDTVFGLEIEVSFAEIYSQQPLFGEVDQFVREQGFHLIDLRTISWKRSVGANVGNSKGQLMHADALYFKRITSFKDTLTGSYSAFARSKLLRALSICRVYGFLDYGLELLDRMGHDFFEETELQQLKSHIYRHAPLASRIPNFRGRKRLAAMVLKLATWLAPRKHRAAQRRLGNF